MRRAFIVRPFETKEVAPGYKVDFDRIDRELISPALAELGIFGRTTAEILRQGEIQGDMFHRLVATDLVIADISIPNANVFYELGIRHALQDRHTVLIKFRFEGQRAVFDIATDRYMVYDAAAPGKSVGDLVKRIQATLDENKPDSPVFRFLTRLKPQERHSFVTAPPEFLEDVELALRRGHDAELDLYATELLELDIPWASAGLRSVGEAQFKRKAWDAARRTWEAISEASPNDPLPNRKLATIYQKQSKPDLDCSDITVSRALAGAHPELAAELYALRGSNSKTRWLKDWRSLPDLESRRKAALASSYLADAFDEYHSGFAGYLNHYYSGINALALLKVRVDLAKALPDTWSARFKSEQAAGAQLMHLEEELGHLRAAVRVSIQAAAARQDRWAVISQADYECLVSDRPAYVRSLYEDALKDADEQARDAARRQLEILRDLAIQSDVVAAGLEALAPRGSATTSEPPALAIVFSGHRLDKAGAPPTRFPAPAEPLARAMIRDKLVQLKDGTAGPIVGYAGCASGGDILFHEVCDELGIPTTALLAGPRGDYLRESVQDAGPDWVRRFDAIVSRRGNSVRQLTRDLKLPRWLRGVENFGVWQHNNLWTLHSALVHGGSQVVLVALWNGQAGTGPGGTEHMVSEVRKRGGRAEILDAKQLLPAT